MDSFKSVNFNIEEELLPTNIGSIDTILGGGIPVGRVTEIYGQAGVGKTQLCLQLCANVELLNEQSVYLDCHGGFNSKRLYDICNASHRTANKRVFKIGKSCLDNIFYKRIDNLDQMTHALDDLVTGILPNSHVKLLIIDSIAFHFRYSMLDANSDMNSLLHGVVQKLNILAYKWKMAVIVTNQMTTRSAGSSDVSTGGDLIPALGESWSHSCTTSIQLNFVHVETSQNKKNIVREVNIMKSPLVKYPSKAFFTISEEGVRDLDFLKKA